MTIETQVSHDHVQTTMDKIIGEYIWGASVLDGRILQVEFGEPYLRILQVPRRRQGEPFVTGETRRLVRPAGRWTLFVEEGSWSVHADGQECARFALNNANESQCLDSLNGQKLTGVVVASDQEILTMTFDLGGIISVRVNFDFDQNDQLMLFSNGEGVLSCDGKGEFLMEI